LVDLKEAEVFDMVMTVRRGDFRKLQGLMMDFIDSL
jgi:hypothetical protein